VKGCVHPTATGTMPATLIAYDGSGSTVNHAFYHDETQRIVAALPKDSQILFWDTAGHVISHARLAEINRKREGGGGTVPAAIADHVARTGFSGDLIIITDGQVGSIDGVAARLKGTTRFNSVTAHLINTGGEVNMSVTCPFTRNSPHTVYLYDQTKEKRLATSVTAEDLAIVGRLREINTVADYEAAAASLEKAVIAATMGTTGDPALRDALLAMKARIMRAEARAKGDSDTVRALTAALSEKNMGRAVSLAHTLTREYYGTDTEDPDAKTWSARISRLISMTEGALRGTFDLSGISAAIRGDRARRAPLAQAAPAEAAPLSAADTAAFECPITCDVETDVALLVADGEPLLTDVDKDIANNLYDCPLNLLNYPELVTALKERLDHPVSLRALKEAYDTGHPFEMSPMTRRPVAAGAICLGANEEHCKATTWTLTNLFTGGKRVGNQDLWFALIWLLVERGEIPYLDPILPQLRAHMGWRLLNHESSVSLTGVPEFPTTRVPLRTAVWYVFASAEFGMEPRRDVLRAHLPHLAALQSLLELSGLTVSDAVRGHLARLRTMLSILSWVKRDRYRLPNLITALTQACVEIDVGGLRVQYERTAQFIPIDGAASEEQVARVRELLPEAGRTLSVAELVGLAALVDPSKSAGDIVLPISWTPPPLAPAALSWPGYGLREIPVSPVRICEATCRPYYHPRPAETWVTAAEKHYGVSHTQMLSANEAYINFVLKYRQYPTRDELLTYLYNRQILHGGRASLPHQATQFVDEALAENAELVAALPAAEFARRAEASRKIEDRIVLESAA